MAEPVKRGDRYRHIVMVDGRRYSGTFDTKKEARQWEAELRVKQPDQKPKTRKLTEAVDKYLSTVSVHKRNAVAWETRRFNEFLSAMPRGISIGDVTSEMLADWRDMRRSQVSDSTVVRESNLIRSLFRIAANEWQWIEQSPFNRVKLPKQNPPRDQTWNWRQIRRVLRAGEKCGGGIQEVARAFHISLHTGLRLQEALVATKHYDRNAKVLKLPPTKTEKFGEKVPVTANGRRVIEKYMDYKFTVGPNEASVLFSRLKKYAMIDGVQFRDARATALTMLSRKVDILTLARISRHKNMELLRSTYCRETAEQISARL